MKSKIIKSPVLSLNAKVEQIAKLLRKEAKKHSCQIHELSTSNLIHQIAKKLRTELHAAQKKKNKAA